MNREQAPTPHDQWIKRAVVGGAIWIAWALVARPQWTAILLLLSPFVLLPLGLRLASSSDTGPETPGLRLLARLAPVLAMTAAASFLAEPGVVAALLSLPWLGFTVAVALAGVGRLLSRRTLATAGIGADAGLLFVAVGGGWLAISRAGLNPLGFSDAIVQLTAVHFHYAGFALPIVAGFTASRLERSPLIPLAVIIGVPLTAIGITAGGWLEWFAATAMASAGIATATLLLRLAGGKHPGRWLVGTAGLALLAGMSLALGWSWSMRFSWQFLELESMAATHGSLNALGFGLLGLLGLNALVADSSPETAVANVHLGRPSDEVLQRLAAHAAHQATTNPPGLLGHRRTPTGFRYTTWQRTVEHGDFGAAADAIRQWRAHDAARIDRCPTRPKIAEGETLALAIPIGPISISATCRIIDVIDEPDRFGFTYATLPHHPEDGEESFIVTRHADGRVDFTITAVWRPATVANRLCPPVTRALQNRVVNQYLEGIASAAASTRAARAAH